jgi:hypothetical protein
MRQLETLLSLAHQREHPEWTVSAAGDDGEPVGRVYRVRKSTSRGGSPAAWPSTAASRSPTNPTPHDVRATNWPPSPERITNQ